MSSSESIINSLKCANLSQILSKDHLIKYCTLETPLKTYKANDSHQNITVVKIELLLPIRFWGFFNLILLMTTGAYDIP